jgi:uncharacterized protein (TIGR02421 family)
MNADLIRELDTALIATAKKIRVLAALAWPTGVEAEFLSGWSAGRPRLPQCRPVPPRLGGTIADLESIAARCDRGHPVGRFLSDTALSYAEAGRMVSAVGTPDFTRHSVRIYGRPDRIYKSQGLSGVDAATYFLKVTDDLLGDPQFPATTAGIPAEAFAAWLTGEVNQFFSEDTVAVVLDPEMSSKALAGATRVRVRAGALFSPLDKDQLLHHEAYVHTATQLNGRKQANLRSLGLGAPRTTRTQEGIAVLAELITFSIDIARLRRVALRVIAVQMALDGADFIEVFQFFLEAGQSEEESVRSAQRIFRGGGTGGGIVFTKDAVYLHGLIEVHTFLRLAIRDNRPGLVRHLFAGRLTLADTIRLSPFFESGWLRPPVYLPTWAADLRRMAAMMAYSAFMTKVDLDLITLDRAAEFEDEMTAAA